MRFLSTAFVFVFVFVFVYALSLRVSAQSLAPAIVNGDVLTLTITGGSAPFASSGQYKLFTLPTEANFFILGPAEAGLSSGAYAYAKSEPETNAAAFTLTDSQSGKTFSLSLSFSSAAAGAFALSGGAGAQSGSFSMASYFQISPPNMILSRLTNGHFESCLSGQIGLTYQIDSSGDLTSWTPFTNLALADLTTNIDAALVGAPRYFRTRVSAAAFAPDSIANKTFNQTITAVSGAVAGGIRQWTAALSGATFQINAGPGGANSSGAYVFSRTGPATAQITSTDSLAGNVSQQLFFTSPQSGWFYESNTAGTQSGSFSMADGAVAFLGNISFIADAARAVSLAFPADGTPQTLTVTNAAGWAWTLSFPGDALLNPRTITMTPFNAVDSKTALLPITNGVQLEPDGLQFCDSVTLTVTPPVALGPHATLVMANDDGSDFYLALTTNTPGQYSTQLLHFTSAAASNPSDDDWNNFVENHASQFEAAYQEDVNQVEALEHPVVTPPEPPDYELQCDPSKNAQADKQIDAYEKALFAKESAAIQQMLSDAAAIQFLTGDSSPADDALGYARDLVESSAYRKVDSLFSAYSGNPKKMVAVTRTALLVQRQDALLGGSDPRSDWSEQIRSWAGRVKDYYLDKLRNEHDYSMVPVLYQVWREMILLQVPVDQQIFLEDLANAMTFKLTENISMTVNGGDASFAAAGDVSVTGNPTGASIFPLQGSASIPYQDSYDGPAVLIGGQSFVQNPKVDNFDACKQMTADIILDRFGADSETWNVQGYTYSIPGQLNPTAKAFFATDGYEAESGPYLGLDSFPVSIANLNPQAASQTFVSVHSDNGDTVTITLTLTLTHTPK